MNFFVNASPERRIQAGISGGKQSIQSIATLILTGS
jgi:hypothetical protein